MTKPKQPLGPWTQREVSDLRFDANQAYLDGRTARARALNRKADDLDRKLRESVKVAVS